MDSKNIRELARALEAQWERVSALKSFLKLKQSELRVDDYPSLCGYLEAKEECRIEEFALLGHAQLLSQELARRRAEPDHRLARLLKQIQQMPPIS